MKKVGKDRERRLSHILDRAHGPNANKNATKKHWQFYYLSALTDEKKVRTAAAGWCDADELEFRETRVNFEEGSGGRHSD